MSNQPLFKRISNSVFESPFFRGHKFTDNEARIYLYYLAYDANEGLHAIVPINGNYVKIYPGEVAMGCRKLAEIFGWDKKKVSRFYNKMEEFGELEIRLRRPVMVVKLLHYVPRLTYVRDTLGTDEEQLYNKQNKHSKHNNIDTSNSRF
tara:strand:- start:1100 stop:1546 length:447 start_codon:yes stop_codon:yes gene_type:complete